MSRILFWLGLAFLVTFAIRSKLRDLQQRNEQLRRQHERPAGPQSAAGSGAAADSQAGYQARVAEKAVAEAETMLQCAHCGVFYPASETVRSKGHDYCSAAHASLPAAYT